jgi:vacuolar-type H+-ATPase subunit F/Vma7
MNQTDPYIMGFNGSGVNNEDVFAEYLEKVVSPWANKNHIRVVLILDEASCHHTAKICNILEENAMLPIFIPGGAISILQSLDVELNKSLKSEIRRMYEKWLDNEAAKGKPSVVPPDLLNIIEWANSALQNLPNESISKSFLTTGISAPLEQCIKDEWLILNFKD